MLASLRAHPRPGVSSSDQAQERGRARELFDRVCRALGLPEDSHPQLNSSSHSQTRSERRIAEDVDLHVEIARLWQGENHDRVQRALKEALRISEAGGQTDPRLVNNLGALYHLQDDLASARHMYETALTHAADLQLEAAEGMSTSILYNLARVYEDQVEYTMASEAYAKLLARHPEYVDGECDIC